MKSRPFLSKSTNRFATPNKISMHTSFLNRNARLFSLFEEKTATSFIIKNKPFPPVKFASLTLPKSIYSTHIKSPLQLKTWLSLPTRPYALLPYTNLQHNRNFHTSLPKYAIVDGIVPLTKIFNEYQYMETNQFTQLSFADKKSLRDILFTTLGLYAIEKNYLSVKQFLALPLEVRDDLKMIFWNEPLLYQDSQFKRVIDYIFNKLNLDLNQFTYFTAAKRHAIMTLLSFPLSKVSTVLMEDKCFSINAFIALNEKQQQTIIDLMQQFRIQSNFDFSSSEYKTFLAVIKNRMTEFTIHHNPIVYRERSWPQERVIEASTKEKSISTINDLLSELIPDQDFKLQHTVKLNIVFKQALSLDVLLKYSEALAAAGLSVKVNQAGGLYKTAANITVKGNNLEDIAKKLSDYIDEVKVDRLTPTI